MSPLCRESVSYFHIPGLLILHDRFQTLPRYLYTSRLGGCPTRLCLRLMIRYIRKEWRAFVLFPVEFLGYPHEWPSGRPEVIWLALSLDRFLGSPRVCPASLERYGQVLVTSPSAAIGAIFSRPRDAAAILFLIEDSSYMVPLWQRLRDSYLPAFLTAIKNANPLVPVGPFTSALPRLPIIAFQAEALWMTASEQVPFKPTFDPSARRSPCLDDIPAINLLEL